MIDYDAHDWRQHLFDIKGSMVRQIFYRVLFCAAWAAVVVYIHREHFRVDVSGQGHALMGTVLGLLLVFRTNSSYDRFWESRKMWGAIINETRNVARAASVFLAEAPDLARLLVLWTMAFPSAVMYYLRGSKGLGEAAELLPLEDVKRTLEANNVPLAVSRRMSEQLDAARRRGVLSDYMTMTLDQNVQLLIDYMGACERIRRTPLPFAYVVHLRRVVLLFCYTLPFALVDTFGWITVFVTLLVSYALLGIEEIGVEIEDPFGYDDNDLPLERFCGTIEMNLHGVLDTFTPGPAANPPAGLPPPQSRR